jgi:hypothetical protein
MKKRTRSILDELNSVHGNKDSDHFIDSTANNIIESSINLLSRIHNMYDDETSYELERRFINSIRTGDPRKFKRSITKIIESKKNDNFI